MPDEYKCSDPIQAYHDYYINEKSKDMFMEKKGNPTVHDIVGNNVIPFTSKQTISDAEKYAEATFKQKKQEKGTFLETEVDVLVCSM